MNNFFCGRHAFADSQATVLARVKKANDVVIK